MDKVLTAEATTKEVLEVMVDIYCSFIDGGESPQSMLKVTSRQWQENDDALPKEPGWEWNEE